MLAISLIMLVLVSMVAFLYFLYTHPQYTSEWKRPRKRSGYRRHLEKKSRK